MRNFLARDEMVSYIARVVRPKKIWNQSIFKVRRQRISLVHFKFTVKIMFYYM